MQLAVALHKTRAEILAMGLDEIRHWIAFNAICPLPDSHWQTGLLAEVQAHCHGFKGEFDPSHWIPGEKPEQTRDEVELRLKAHLGAFKKQRGNRTHQDRNGGQYKPAQKSNQGSQV